MGKIVTVGGNRPTVEQIKVELANKGIDVSQVEVTNIKDTTAIIKPTSNSTKYKGDQVIVRFKAISINKIWQHYYQIHKEIWVKFILVKQHDIIGSKK